MFTGMTNDGGQGHFGPGQGQGGPPPGPPPGPPRIEPGELRPKRLWYVVAGAVGVVLIGLGVLSLVRTLTGAIDSIDKDGRFRSGESLTLNLESGQERAVSVDQLNGSTFRYDCRATGPDDPTLERPEGSFKVTAGGHTWQRVLVLKAHGTGEHTVTCQAGTDTEFAVGEKPERSGFVGGLLLTIGLPVVGLISCTLIAVLTAVRRGRHRRRLLAERFTPPPYGGPSYGQPPHGGQPPYGGPPQQGWGPPPGPPPR